MGGHPVLTKELFTQRTRHYQHWVESFAANHNIPIRWPEEDERKEETVQPFLRRRQRQNRCGVYYIFRSMEQGPTFAVRTPRYPTDDPNYRILRSQRGRYTHYYFYILDAVVGPMILRVGSFLPFGVTAWFNGHHFIERELIRQKVDFMIVGLSAASLQGAPVVTQGIDLWFRDLGQPGIKRALKKVS